MRLPKNWNQPKKPTEAEVLELLKLGFEAAQLIGMPVVICAIKPSDEERVIHQMIRADKEIPGHPSHEDAMYLASTVLFNTLGCYPEEARALMKKVIVEFADEVVYERMGGPIPPHMIESDYPPSVMGEEGGDA